MGNRVKYRFVDTPLLPGITVHESWGHVVVLVPTVGSVHKLSFPHPAKLGQAGGVESVLAEASLNTARECQHILAWPASSPLPSLASTFFTHDEVRFSLSTLDFSNHDINSAFSSLKAFATLVILVIHWLST